jgi:hypothetical protein
VIGDGDAVGIAADVGIDMLSAVERLFGVDHPFLLPDFLRKRSEDLLTHLSVKKLPGAFSSCYILGCNSFSQKLRVLLCS